MRRRPTEKGNILGEGPYRLTGNHKSQEAFLLLERTQELCLLHSHSTKPHHITLSLRYFTKENVT